MLGEDQDARSELVEAMADVGVRTAVLGIDVVIDELLCRLFAVVGAGSHCQQSRLLLNHHQVGILVDHAGHRALQAGEGSGEVDQHLVVVLQLFVKLRGNLPVVLHVSVLQVALYLCSALRSKLLHHERKKLAGFVNPIDFNMVRFESSGTTFRITSFHRMNSITVKISICRCKYTLFF